MKYKFTKLSIVFFLSFVLTALHAQEAIPCSGGNALGIGGSVSYSVGQVFYITNTGTNGSAAQGVQQPFEISVIIGIEEAKDISLTFLAFPNPTNDYLILKVVNYNMENLMYQLFDINGKLLECKKTENNETKISMENLSSAIYFIKIIQESKEIKTFKIIKN